MKLIIPLEIDHFFEIDAKYFVLNSNLLQYPVFLFLILSEDDSP